MGREQLRGSEIMGGQNSVSRESDLKPLLYDPVGRTAARLRVWGPLQAEFRRVDKLRPIDLASDLAGQTAEKVQGTQQAAFRGNGRA